MTAPSDAPENVLTSAGGHPLAVGMTRHGHRMVVPYDPDAGLVRFMYRWRPWAMTGDVPEDCVSFVGWVVP